MSRSRATSAYPPRHGRVACRQADTPIPRCGAHGYVDRVMRARITRETMRRVAERRPSRRSTIGSCPTPARPPPACMRSTRRTTPGSTLVATGRYCVDAAQPLGCLRASLAPDRRGDAERRGAGRRAHRRRAQQLGVTHRRCRARLRGHLRAAPRDGGRLGRGSTPDGGSELRPVSPRDPRGGPQRGAPVRDRGVRDLGGHRATPGTDGGPVVAHDRGRGVRARRGSRGVRPAAPWPGGQPHRPRRVPRGPERCPRRGRRPRRGRGHRDHRLLRRRRRRGDLHRRPHPAADVAAAP